MVEKRITLPTKLVQKFLVQLKCVTAPPDKIQMFENDINYAYNKI